MKKTLLILFLFFFIFCNYLSIFTIDPIDNSKIIKKGLEEIRAKHFDTAINIFKRAIVRDSYDLEAHYLLAATYYSMKKYKKSKNELDKILVLDPENKKATALLNSIEAIESDFKISKPSDNKKEKDKKILTLLSKAKKLSKTFEKKKSIKIYKKVLELDKKNYDALLALSKLEEKFGDENRVINYFDQLMKYHSEKKEVYKSLASYFKRSVKIDRAIMLSNQYLKKSKNKEEMEKILVSLYMRSQDYKKGEKILLKRLKNDGNNIEFLKLLSELYKNNNELKKEIDVLKKIHKLDKNDSKITLRLSETFEKAGLEDSAFSVMLSISPENRGNHYFRRLIKLGKKNGEIALVIGAYERLIGLDDSKKLKMEFINFLCKKDKYDGAIEKIGEYLKTDPENIQLIRKLKEISLTNKNDKIAFKALKKYIKIYPNSYSSRKRLKFLAKKLGKKINLNKNTHGKLYIFNKNEFESKYIELKNDIKTISNGITYIFKNRLIYKIKKDGIFLNYCNVKALEKLLNKLYMENSEVKRLVSYEYLIKNFDKIEIDGVIILIKYKIKKDSKFDSEVILVTSTDNGDFKIKKDKYYYPIIPAYLKLPKKIIYDNDIPLNPKFEEYNKERIISRYNVLDKLFTRIEVEKIAIVNNIIERTSSTEEEDIFTNMESIKYLTVTCGIQSKNLTLYINSIKNNLNDKYSIELLENMENTYSFLSYIKRSLDKKSPTLLARLNNCKNSFERKKLLGKYFKKSDLIFKIIY